MPVDSDVSFYPTAQPKPINPLEMAQGYASIQHTLQENQLQQQQIKGKIATGRILSQAQNSDGSTNMNQAMNLIMKDPDARIYALETQSQLEHNNQPTAFMGKDPDTGQPVQRQAPLPNVIGMGNPGQQAMTQDQMWTHLNTGEELSSRIADHDSPSIRDVNSAIIDGVSHPDFQFNAHDAASTYAGLPHGQGGALPDSQQIKGAAIQQRDKIRQAKAALLKQGYVPPELRNQQTVPDNTQGTATGLPAGYQENQQSRQKHYLDIQDAANSVPVENAALNNILNISKSGAPSGTMVGQIYQALASTGLAPKGIEDKGAQLKILQNHASQISLAGGVPGNIPALEALQNAKVDDKDLPEVIQGMVPYLLAVNEGKIQRAKFYSKNAPNGMNPDAVTKAQSTWNENFDPRILELKQLAKDPAQLKKYTSSLSKQDKANLLEKYNNSKQLGILGQ